MSADVTARDGWTEERVLHLLPLGLLAVATVVSVAAAPALGDAAAPVPVTLALSAVTAAWILLTPRGTAWHWVVRSLLAFALCWLNPFFAIFAFVGFYDVFTTLRAPWSSVGALLVSVTQAGSQSGGFPPSSAAQGLAFAALVAVNLGLATTFTRIAEAAERRTVELERLNAGLEQALAENARLHAQVLAQARSAGAQEERQRLAREIHDTLAQSLAGIVTQLRVVAAEPDPARLAAVTDLAREALAEARRSVLDLAPAPLDGGVALPAALAAVVDGWSAQHAVKADLVLTGEPVPVHPEVEATTVRIVQESLTNVARHAAATRVGVTLSYDDAELILDVRDDGVGFDTTRPARTGAFGLRSMRQRAERLAGVLEVESETGHGSTVTARLPAVPRGAA